MHSTVKYLPDGRCFKNYIMSGFVSDPYSCNKDWKNRKIEIDRYGNIDAVCCVYTSFLSARRWRWAGYAGNIFYNSRVFVGRCTGKKIQAGKIHLFLHLFMVWGL